MSPALAALAGLAAALLLVWLRGRLFGFAAQRPADYVAAGPALDLREALAGPMLCDGVIFGPRGRAGSRFTAQMQAEWSGAQCRLAEQFRYESGAEDRREWLLTLGNDGRIEARAGDVVGPGRGRVCGNALVLRYRIRLGEDAGGHLLSVTDWMYLTPSGTIVNRSQFRKWGFLVAELVATIRRVPI